MTSLEDKVVGLLDKLLGKHGKIAVDVAKHGWTATPKDLQNWETLKRQTAREIIHTATEDNLKFEGVIKVGAKGRIYPSALEETAIILGLNQNAKEIVIHPIWAGAEFIGWGVYTS